jgi:hypothetical protein
MTQIAKSTNADRAPMRQWLTTLNAAVRNPQSEADLLRLRLPAIAHTTSDLPPEAWNPSTLRTAMERFQFWPSAAEIREVLADWTREQRPATVRMGAETGIGHAIERIAGPEQCGRSPEEVEHVKAQVAALKAEMAADATTGERPKPKTAYLDRIALARIATPAILATRPDLRAALDAAGEA